MFVYVIITNISLISPDDRHWFILSYYLALAARWQCCNCSSMVSSVRKKLNVYHE